MTTIIPDWALGPAALVCLFLTEDTYIDYRKVTTLSVRVGAGIGAFFALPFLNSADFTLKSVSRTILTWSWEGAKVGMISSAILNISQEAYEVYRS